ncbi:MAG: hypothetical protein ACJ763_12195 [Bdellovibrionia bacterium]
MKHLRPLVMGLVLAQVVSFSGARAEEPATSHWTLGAQAVVCHEASGDRIFPLSRLGHYEHEFEPISGANWQSVLDGIFSRVARLNPSRAKRFREKYAELMTTSRFLSGVSLQYQDQPWPPVSLPGGCETRSIAVLRAEAMPLQPRLIVDSDLWNKLDDQSRAITFFEILFSDELWHYSDPYSHPSYESPMTYIEAHYKKVWKISTLVTSKEMSQQSQDSWLKLLQEVFYGVDGDWNGCRFPVADYLRFQTYSDAWSTTFLDGPCPVLIQGKKVSATEVKVDADGRVAMAVVADAELSTRSGKKVAVSGWAYFDQDGFLTTATLKGIQTFTSGSGQEFVCQIHASFDSKTGVLEECEIALPIKIETPHQKIELSPVTSDYQPCQSMTSYSVSFLPNGDWNPLHGGSYACQYVARGNFLISNQWVRGERFAGDDFALANFKLDQDVSYQVKGIDFAAKAGEKIPVYFDEKGHFFMGGKISQSITVDTSDGKHTLGTGKCFPNFWKTYDSTTLFYPDGKLAMGVIPGDSQFYMQPHLFEDGRVVELHGTARVVLNRDGTIRDWDKNLCNDPPPH